MKIANFKLVKDGDTKVATVDMITGCLWWKKTKTVYVAKDGVFWWFVETGKFTPGTVVENLEKSYRIKQLLN